MRTHYRPIVASTLSYIQSRFGKNARKKLEYRLSHPRQHRDLQSWLVPCEPNGRAAHPAVRALSLCYFAWLDNDYAYSVQQVRMEAQELSPKEAESLTFGILFPEQRVA